MKSLLALATIAVVLAGCVAGAVVTEPPSAAVTEPPTSTPVPTTGPTASVPPLPTDPSQPLAAVSKFHPSPGAAEAMAKCHIGDMIVIDKVAGMAELPAAADILRYVPLTGREPQLKEPGPVWVIQIKGDVQQLGGEVWTDPTCVVTESVFGYFATGPVTNTATGKVTLPEAPAVMPSQTLPPLAP